MHECLGRNDTMKEMKVNTIALIAIAPHDNCSMLNFNNYGESVYESKISMHYSINFNRKIFKVQLHLITM